MSESTPHHVVVYPAWADNPYLNMAYVASRAAGTTFTFITAFDAAVKRARKLTAGETFHLHWTQQICQEAADEADAWHRLRRFTDALDGALARGVALVWTIHNAAPHERKFLAPESELYRYLAAHATLVHAMSESTAEVLSEVCTLDPGTTRYVPHPSYHGIYESAGTREELRERRGIRPGTLSLFFIGQMRPYKGLDVLAEAMALLEDRGSDVTLLMAGRARPHEIRDVDEAFARPLRAARSHSFVADEDIPAWYGAADLLVVPYQDILNSGSMFLAATFGVPVLLPAIPHVVAQFDAEPWVLFYDPEEGPEGLADAIDAFEDPDGALREAALRFARSYGPFDMSRDMARVLVEARDIALASAPPVEDAAS